MQKKTEKQLAKAPYSWLRASPILTVTTYFFVAAAGFDEGFAILGSALWHLLLLQYINNKESDFVRWHGLQAALVAGVRTLIPAAFLIIDSILGSNGYFFCWTIPVLIIVWAIATPWGNKQVENGVCTLAKWTGNNVVPSLEHEEINQTIPQNLNISSKQIMAELLSDDAVTRLSALMKLDSATQISEEILLELKVIAVDDENEDARKDAAEILGKFSNPPAMPISKQEATREINMDDDKSLKPEIVLKNVLNGLQSDDDAKRLDAISQLHRLSYSSEAIRNELEKLALHDPNKVVRLEALAALDLATHRNVRIRFNKIERGNRYVLLQEIKDWEKLGFLEKHTADVIRRRYDFDFTIPPAPRRAPVQPAAPAPKPVPAQPVASASVPMKASQLVATTTSQPVQAKAIPAVSKPLPAAKTPAIPKPVTPPKPKQPPIDWKKVRERVADAASSGALLRALLYLGAFMIVISATVLVVRFWNIFNPILQLLFISSVPLIFYVGGWTLRSRLKLIQAGTVLTGIGAILVAVDFAAIYQLSGLASSVNGSAYWLGVAVFCTILYAFTTWKMQGEFFDYLTLIAGTGMFFALTSLLQLPFEWSVVSVTASAAIMTGIAGRFWQATEHWRNLARASRYLSQILIPASIIFIVFSNASLPIMTAFLLATIAYSILAWKFPSVVFAYSALGASIGTVLFALSTADMPQHWYATVGSVLAIVYILIGQPVKRANFESKIIQSYTKALNITGFILISLAALDGLILTINEITFWPGVIALAISSLDLAVCAYLFQHSRYTLLASGLAIVPFTLAIGRWLNDAETLQGLTWLSVAWSVLALTYIGLAALLRKASSDAKWLHAWAHVLIPFALFITYFDYLTSVYFWARTPALISLGVCFSGYLVTFILQDSGKHSTLSSISNWIPFGLGKAIFLWPIGLLLPIFMAVAWYGTDFPHAWFGATLAGFALAYLGAGQLLFKRAKEYRFPLHVFVYLLCLIAIPWASPDRYALLTALLITVASAGILAYLYSRVFETIIASLLFIWPFQLLLEIFKVESYSQALGYVLLGSLAYIPIAIYIKQIKKSDAQNDHMPIFLTGYAVTVYAVIASLFGRTSDTFAPWVGMTIPLIATALYTFSVSYFKNNKYGIGWAWAGTLTFAIAFGQSLTLFKVPAPYDALAWVSLAFAYMVIERLLSRVPETGTGKIEHFWFAKFHWPLITGILILLGLGLNLSLPDTLAAFAGIQLASYVPPILAQLLLVVLSIASARLYQQRWPLFIEPFLAFLPATLFFIGYGERIFKQPLTTPQFALVWTGLGAIHLLTAVLIDRAKVRYAYGLYLGAYILLTWSLVWSVFDQGTLVWSLGLWILALLSSAILVHFGRHQTWDEFNHLIFGKSKGGLQTTAHNAFQWLTAFAIPIWLVLFLRQINIPEEFAWLGLVTPPLVYLGLAEWLQKIDRAYTYPLHTSAQFYTAIALLVSAPLTLRHLAGDFLQTDDKTGLLAFIILQTIAVVFYAASAWRLSRRSFAHIASWLSFFPYTLAWIFYNPAMATYKFALPWMGLSAALLIIGLALDKNKIRYSHGPYLVGYLLSVFALLWSINDQTTLVWSLGIWILVLIGSALLVHFGRHQTWDDFIHSLFGDSQSTVRATIRNTFQWLAAWTFPVWCVLFLREINVQADFIWLGLAIPPLAYLGLALWLRRIDQAYTYPLHSSAQFYTAIGLLISAPATTNFLSGISGGAKNTFLAFIILQTLAVAFYAASAWMTKARGYAHISAWLSIIPFTVAWKIYGATFTPIKIVIPWLIWSTVLLAIGFALDKNKTRYSHGPYVAGYVLAIYALACSVPDRITNIYALGITILLAVLSYLVVHFGRHHSFEDFLDRFWKRSPEVTQQIVSTIFLFFASYATPILLSQILTHLKLDLAVRGAALAIAAPLFIAIGLAVRNSKSRSMDTVPTWPLYSTGYVLTAIGAMISFGDEQLAIYVLILNTIVYTVSAYIFQQAFWLYLSTVLVPIIALLVLHKSDRLETNWVAWIFIALSYLYLLIGQIFDRAKKAENYIHPFAAPFYAPGFLLSAIALAISSSDKMLALQVYSAGVLLYALAGWRFREALFIYPASWLATVPYYLLVTISDLDTRWYGLAWLPLIVLYIALGRFVFHKRPLPPVGKGVLAEWLSHPATPLYLLAYSLSVSMISLSYISPLSLTLAFAAAAVIYFGSAYLFRAPSWIYAGLFATHMAVLAYFTISPSGRGIQYITLPFLAMTWLTALFGYGFSRRITESDTTVTHRGLRQNEAFRFSLLNRLFGHPWSRPFFAFAIGEMFIWQTVAMKGYDTTIILGSGHALLLALFSILWAEGVLVYGMVAFGLLAVGAWMKQSGFEFTDSVAVYGGIGFGLYLFARLIEPISARIKSLTVWLMPLTHSAIALTAGSVVVNLPFVISHMTVAAASLAFAGALYVAIAYRGRRYQLGYLGMALLEVAWAMALYMSDVIEPQWYAIPGGLYFMGLAYLEWQRNKSKYAIGIELLGLGVLLITSFAQSLNSTNGFPYFVLLLIESMLIIGWGTIQKRKIPFFTGIGFVALNFIAQVIMLVNVGIINIWYVGLGTGLLIMAIAVFVELKREQLRARTREWSETLERWE